MNFTTGATDLPTKETSEFPYRNVTESFHHSYSVEALILSATSCSLSIIGGVVIFASFIALPEIRNFTRKLVICLTVADMITATAYLMSVIRYANILSGNINYSEESILCEVQSFFTTYSSLVSFFLTSIIAVYIYDTVVNKADRLGTSKWLLAFNVISWIIPGCIVVTALAKNVLGSDETKTGGTGPWCWISTNADNQLMWMLLTGKGWEIACYLITMVLYMLLKFHLVLHYRRERLHLIHVSLRDEDKNFLYVWFLLYVLRMWGTLRFFLYVIVNPPDTLWYMKALLRLQALGDPGQGFCNFFLFCLLDKTVRGKLKQIVCCKRQTDKELSSLLTSDTKSEDEDADQTSAKRLSNEKINCSSTTGYGSMTSTKSETNHRDPVKTTDSRYAYSC